MKTTLFLICFGFAVIVSACSGSKETSGLDSSKWKLTRLNGVAFKLADDKQVTLELNQEGGKVSGKAPCNSYSGTYNEARGQLTFGTIASTKMACDDLSRETEYFAMLKGVTGYSIVPGTLKLLSGGTVVAEFSKTK